MAVVAKKMKSGVADVVSQALTEYLSVQWMRPRYCTNVVQAVHDAQQMAAPVGTAETRAQKTDNNLGEKQQHQEQELSPIAKLQTKIKSKCGQAKKPSSI